MKKARILAFLVTLCMATACFISGTVAKYTSSATATGDLSVAKWDVKVNDTGITTGTFALNLVRDADVNTADGKIAPGTSGSFDVVIKNDSEVAITYDAALTPGTLPDGMTITPAGATTGDLAIGATATITYNWVWTYNNGTDANDLTFAGNSLTVDVVVTATQKD